MTAIIAKKINETIVEAFLSPLVKLLLCNWKASTSSAVLATSPQ